MTTDTPRADCSPQIAILQTLAPVDRLAVRDIRLRCGADTWPEGRLGQTLDLLRERGHVARVEVDTYALTDAGRAALRGGAAHG